MNEQIDDEEKPRTLRLDDDAPVIFGSVEYRRLSKIAGGLDGRVIIRPDEATPEEPQL